MDCSLPGSSVLGISQARYWSALTFPSSGDPSNPRNLLSPVLAGGLFTTSHQESPEYSTHTHTSTNFTLPFLLSLSLTQRLHGPLQTLSAWHTGVAVTAEETKGYGQQILLLLLSVLFNVLLETSPIKICHQSLTYDAIYFLSL